jgi:hypothetical protein
MEEGQVARGMEALERAWVKQRHETEAQWQHWMLF